MEFFEAYVAARFRRLSRVAYLLTGDRQLAEDLTQNALISVARHWERVVAELRPGRLRPAGVVPAARVVVATQPDVAGRAASEPPDRDVPDFAPNVALAVSVRQALGRLAPRQRAALVLRYFEDLSEVEAAEVLGCSVGTVKGPQMLDWWCGAGRPRW